MSSPPAALPLRRRHLPALAAAWVLLPAHAAAVPPELSALWPQARRIGQGRLRFLGLRVYEARLWSPAQPTRDDWPRHEFALELEYARDLPGTAIAERSLVEMRRQGPIADDDAGRWLATLRSSLPDVRSGDRLCGVHRSDGTTRIHYNGAARADWSDAALTRRFFGIWLAPQTSEPALREALFGGRDGERG